MKLIAEATKNLQKAEIESKLKERFDSPSDNTELPQHPETEGVLEVIDEEDGNTVYIEWGFVDGEYEVYGMSYYKDGPFLETDPNTNWSEWAEEQLRNRDPFGAAVSAFAVENTPAEKTFEGFKLKYTPVGNT